MVVTGSSGSDLDSVETIRITEASNEVTRRNTWLKGVQVHHGENNGFIDNHVY